MAKSGLLYFTLFLPFVIIILAIIINTKEVLMTGDNEIKKVSIIEEFY